MIDRSALAARRRTRHEGWQRASAEPSEAAATTAEHADEIARRLQRAALSLAVGTGRVDQAARGGLLAAGEDLDRALQHMRRAALEGIERTRAVAGAADALRGLPQQER